MGHIVDFWNSLFNALLWDFELPWTLCTWSKLCLLISRRPYMLPVLLPGSIIWLICFPFVSITVLWCPISHVGNPLVNTFVQYFYYLRWEEKLDLHYSILSRNNNEYTWLLFVQQLDFFGLVCDLLYHSLPHIFKIILLFFCFWKGPLVLYHNCKQKFSLQGTKRSVVCYMKCHVLMRLLQFFHWYFQTFSMGDQFNEYQTVLND